MSEQEETFRQKLARITELAAQQGYQLKVKRYHPYGWKLVTPEQGADERLPDLAAYGTLEDIERWLDEQLNPPEPFD
ncbi:hypothetical protein D5S18_14205 [Nocardia panacis]|uniref:Uncharacterized protein n=1 Tax=Nocardia panacis TaxID=2340916 RepID=A0A3A4KL79_9NOCA|nr:hypothetical protein [Nocardia panacis]RJO75581.1 hypothetical protein D5S18_14205 [Nocardia panacis]